MCWLVIVTAKGKRSEIDFQVSTANMKLISKYYVRTCNHVMLYDAVQMLVQQMANCH